MQKLAVLRETLWPVIETGNSVSVNYAVNSAVSVGVIPTRIASEHIQVITLKSEPERSIGFKDIGPYLKHYLSHALLFPNGSGSYTMRGVSKPLMLVSLDDTNRVIQSSFMSPGISSVNTHEKAKDVLELSPELYDRLKLTVGSEIQIVQNRLVKIASDEPEIVNGYEKTLVSELKVGDRFPYSIGTAVPDCEIINITRRKDSYVVTFKYISVPDSYGEVTDSWDLASDYSVWIQPRSRNQVQYFKISTDDAAEIHISGTFGVRKYRDERS